VWADFVVVRRAFSVFCPPWACPAMISHISAGKLGCGPRGRFRGARRVPPFSTYMPPRGPR
jgi:hypothetical protein